MRSITRPFIGTFSLNAFSRSSQARKRTASARDSIGYPSPVSMFLTRTSTSSPRLTVISPFSMNSAWTDDAFRLVAKVDHHAALSYADDGAAHDFAFLKG